MQLYCIPLAVKLLANEMIALLVGLQCENTTANSES